MTVPERHADAPLSRPSGGAGPANLADILERILDKGIVIAGDIRIDLLDIELLTVRLRLLVASVDKAREMGINWWEGDPSLTRGSDSRESDAMEQRLQRLEAAVGLPADTDDDGVGGGKAEETHERRDAGDDT
jgi:Gas vesicle protein